MKLKFNIFVLCLCLFLLTAMGPVLNAAGTGDKEVRVTIYHMNDVHSQINDFAKIAWLIQQEKKVNPNVFVLNAGDNFSGNPVVDQYKPKGKPILELMKQIKTDVMVIGNHDFDYGRQRLKEAVADAPYPMICANIKVNEGGVIRQPKPYTVLETAEGIKIAVLGLIHVDEDTGIPHTHPDKLKGLTFLHPIETAQKYAHLAKENQALVVLSHMGFREDEKLAEAMDGIDLIVGGHSHTTVRGAVVVNGAVITQAGGYGRYLGRVDLFFKKEKLTKRITGLIRLKDVKEEIPELKAQIETFNKNPQLRRVIATLPGKLEGKDQLGNLICDAVRVRLGLDIALHNSGGIRAGHLGPEVRLMDVFKMLPFGNDIVRFQMTADELKGLIRYGYGKHHEMDLKISGLRYTIVLTADKKIKEVLLTDASGVPLDETRTYSVGFNSYIAGSYRFPHKDPGRALGVIVAQALMDYLEQGGDIYKDIEKIRTFEEVK